MMKMFLIFAAIVSFIAMMYSAASSSSIENLDFALGTVGKIAAAILLAVFVVATIVVLF